MPGKPHKKPVSKAQAGLFGAVASGTLKIPGFSKQEAQDKLRGAKLSKLPASKKKKKR